MAFKLYQVKHHTSEASMVSGIGKGTWHSLYTRFNTHLIAGII